MAGRFPKRPVVLTRYDNRVSPQTQQLVSHIMKDMGRGRSHKDLSMGAERAGLSLSEDIRNMGDEAKKLFKGKRYVYFNEDGALIGTNTPIGKRSFPRLRVKDITEKGTERIIDGGLLDLFKQYRVNVAGEDPENLTHDQIMEFARNAPHSPIVEELKKYGAYEIRRGKLVIHPLAAFKVSGHVKKNLERRRKVMLSR